MPYLPLALVLVGCASDQKLLLIQDADYVPGEVVVGVSAGPAGYASALSEHGFGELDYDPVLDIARLDIGSLSVEDALVRIHGDERFGFSEPNYSASAFATVNDPWAGDQWGLAAMAVYDAWDLGTGTGVVVAVLDTGVQEGSKDGLNAVVAGYDAVYGSDPTYDAVGHGTHVSGTINQRTNNGRGVAGVAHGASIMPVKVLGNNGSGSMYGIAQGMVWACDHGADVINMSLGGGGGSEYVRQAINHCHDADVVIVAATGNEYSSSISYPAAWEGVIAVGATYEGGGRAGYSNYGAGTELMAPGTDILQETPWGFSYYTGTSMATPHVAAVAALVRGAGIEDHDEVREILQQTTTDLGGAGYDVQTGYGLVDAYAAMVEATARVGGEPPDEEEEVEEPEEPQVDTTPPVISDMQAFSPTKGRLVVAWTTDELADGVTEFDPWGDYEVNTELSTDHERTFKASSGHWYSFRVKSTDADGNTVVGPWWKVYVK